MVSSDADAHPNERGRDSSTEVPARHNLPTARAPKGRTRKLRRLAARLFSAQCGIAEYPIKKVGVVGEHPVHAQRDQLLHLLLGVDRVGVDGQTVLVCCLHQSGIHVLLVGTDADGVLANRVKVTLDRLAGPRPVQLDQGQELVLAIAISWIVMRLSALKDWIRTCQLSAAGSISSFASISSSSSASIPGAASGFLVSM